MDQLYGVTKLDEAWSILTKRFGNKMVISQKLKAQLKNVQCTGNSDPEKVINLKIRVRNIVTRLETMGIGAALTHDSEFLSSVYCALPDRHKLRWLEYPKAKSHWDTMLEFLDKSYDMATHELALLSVYTKTDPEKKNVKLAAVNASENGELNTSNDAVSDEDEEVNRFRIAIGGEQRMLVGYVLSATSTTLG